MEGINPIEGLLTWFQERLLTVPESGALFSVQDSYIPTTSRPFEILAQVISDHVKDLFEIDSSNDIEVQNNSLYLSKRVIIYVKRRSFSCAASQRIANAAKINLTKESYKQLCEYTLELVEKKEKEVIASELSSVENEIESEKTAIKVQKRARRMLGKRGRGRPRKHPIERELETKRSKKEPAPKESRSVRNAKLWDPSLIRSLVGAHKNMKALKPTIWCKNPSYWLNKGYYPQWGENPSAVPPLADLLRAQCVYPQDHYSDLRSSGSFSNTDASKNFSTRSGSSRGEIGELVEQSVKGLDYTKNGPPPWANRFGEGEKGSK